MCCFVMGAQTLLPRLAIDLFTAHAEHAANVVRIAKENANLSLKDAVLTFAHKTDAKLDRVFQLVLLSYPQAQHKAVYDAFVQLVASANASHHEVLQEISLKHPDDVFHNELQRRAFDALCSLVSPTNDAG